MKVGVYIPNRNHGHLIGRVLGSVVSQGADEIIVVDDASTDNSVEVVSRYPSVRLIRRAEKSPDHNLAMAPIVDQMESDYLIGVGADDVVYEGLIDAIRSESKSHPAVGVVFTDYDIVDELGNVMSQRRCGFSTVTHLKASEARELLSSRRDMFECGVGAAVSREAHRWLYQNGAYRMGPWTDSVGLSVVACVFGAVYVPSPLAAFTVSLDGSNWHMRVHRNATESEAYRQGIREFFGNPPVFDAVGAECLSAIAIRWGA